MATAAGGTQRSEKRAIPSTLASALGALPTWVAIAGVVSAAAILERLDSAVARMHEPDASSGGVGAVASPTALFAPEHAVAIVEGWRGWTTPVGVCAEAAVWAYALVDVGFALLIALLLISHCVRGG